MKKIKTYCNFDFPIYMENEKQIELYVDVIPSTAIPKDVVRFVLLMEPPEILNISNQAIEGLRVGTYNYLLTHNQDILNKSLDNVHLFEFGTCWVNNSDSFEKKFSVSTLVGGKTITKGHLMRQKLWFRQNKIKVPNNFFLSGTMGDLENYNNNPILGKDKSPLFNSQFHICIENVKRDNFFTEKLIDCLQTKTVPIYWGCPNIGNWFDTRGFIVVNDINEIVEVCNSLNSSTYYNMIEYIEWNFDKSKEFIIIQDRIIKIIQKILK